MLSTNSRKDTFKCPTIDRVQSQDNRRSKALEDQKRKRAQRVDSSRGLENFGNLTLGNNSDDELEEDPQIPVVGVSQFVSMMSQAGSGSVVEAQASAMDADDASPSKKPRRKNKKKTKGKANKWADTCMYAELLEMAEDAPWDAVDPSGSKVKDGLPDDLETGWLAVAPVPKGKRCLAITHTTCGPAGVVPNTTIRSRLLGKALMQPFPSSLPASTVLDCILDEEWRSNGTLHVLDVLKWKGQDIAVCETPFRFWWRDTRIAELPLPSPPSVSAPATEQIAAPSAGFAFGSAMNPTPTAQPYTFPFPTTWCPIPYHSDTSLANLASTIIPAVRTERTVVVHVPGSDASSMDMDGPAPYAFTGNRNIVPVEIHPVSDGLLLYVSQATYESGTGPLSTWIPIVGNEDEAPESHWREFQGVASDMHSAQPKGPLDIFERLVHRRITQSQRQSGDHMMAG